MACKFCNLSSEFDSLKVKEYKYWTVYLSANQSYLGWCMIILKRHLEDFFDIMEDEKDEIFNITRNLRNVVKEIFAPDMFNYATLGNTVRHLHLHVIPRYSKKINFSGFIFEDKRWGQNYAPYDVNFRIPQNALQEIRNALAKKL